MYENILERNFWNAIFESYVTYAPFPFIRWSYKWLKKIVQNLHGSFQNSYT